MARPKAQNVDYFPCYCQDGKVLFILESRWGNAGYAFFYKLWKRLGDADNHYLDLRPLDNWEYFRAKMGVSDTETLAILDKLSEMGVIDPELWSHKIVWSDDFVDSVRDVWEKRKQLIPQKPLFLVQKPGLPPQDETETPISGDHNPQSKVNKSKVNKRSKAPFVFSPPVWLPMTEWSEFVAMRNRIRKPLTPYASHLIVLELGKIQKAFGHSPAAVLNQSIQNSWQDVYPLKNKGAPGAPAPLDGKEKPPLVICPNCKREVTCVMETANGKRCHKCFDEEVPEFKPVAVGAGGQA